MLTFRYYNADLDAAVDVYSAWVDAAGKKPISRLLYTPATLEEQVTDWSSTQPDAVAQEAEASAKASNYARRESSGGGRPAASSRRAADLDEEDDDDDRGYGAGSGVDVDDDEYD